MSMNLNQKTVQVTHPTLGVSFNVRPSSEAKRLIAEHAVQAAEILYEYAKGDSLLYRWLYDNASDVHWVERGMPLSLPTKFHMDRDLNAIRDNNYAILHELVPDKETQDSILNTYCALFSLNVRRLMQV